MSDTRVHAGSGRLQMPRSRGAASGFLLILLGIWGALVPFVGPYFDFAFTPDQEWAWTTARGWLEVLPGAATAVGGFLMLSSRNRFTATETKRVVLELAYFYGLGALIIFLGAIALGRLSIRSARDIRYAQRAAMTTTEPAPSEEVTEIQPAEAAPQPRHRPFGGMFGRRHAPQ